MNLCKETIQDYLYTQEKIKSNMIKLKDKCPEKVLNFLLIKESQSNINNLSNCTYSDKINKKSIMNLLKTKCEDL